MMKRMFGSVRRVCPKTLSTPAAIASDPRAAERRMSRLVCRMDQDSTAPDRSRNRISKEWPCIYLSRCLYLINRDPVLKASPRAGSCAAVLEAAVHEEKTRQKEILT